MVKIKFINVLIPMHMTTSVHKAVMEHEIPVLEAFYGTVEVIDDAGLVREVDAAEEYERLAACYGEVKVRDALVPAIEVAYGHFNSGTFEKALDKFQVKNKGK